MTMRTALRRGNQSDNKMLNMRHQQHTRTHSRMQHQDTENTLERARKLALHLIMESHERRTIYALAAFKSAPGAFLSSNCFDAAVLCAPQGFRFALMDSVKLM